VIEFRSLGFSRLELGSELELETRESQTSALSHPNSELLIEQFIMTVWLLA